jgi:molybdopterin-binding protein
VSRNNQSKGNAESPKAAQRSRLRPELSGLNPKPDGDDQLDIASRLFWAICERYPDRIITFSMKADASSPKAVTLARPSDSTGANERRLFAPIAAIINWRNAMKLSARNQIKGKIIEIKKGVTTAHVRVEIAHEQVVTSSITNVAVEDLALKVGDWAIVVIKASDVMIGVA